jgi:hypothetical protein
MKAKVVKIIIMKIKLKIASRQLMLLKNFFHSEIINWKTKKIFQKKEFFKGDKIQINYMLSTI